MITYIYTLVDPRTEEVRYIGKSNTPNKRYNQHVHRAIKNNERSYKANWIRSLHREGLKPQLIILDEVLIAEWEFWEQHYISLYKSWGFSLTNGTDGGEKCQSEESNIKRGLTSKQRYLNESPEVRQKRLDNLEKGRRDNVGRFKSGKSINAIDINTGEVRTFNSISSASRELNIRENRLRETLDSKPASGRIKPRLQYKGYRFERI